MSETAIRIQNLTRDFNTLRAVDKLSLEIPRGIVFGFLGPNGAGKTTTIYLLLGLLEPTSGKAEVLGFDTKTNANEVRSRIGALLEYPGVYEQLTAEENLEFYGRIWRLTPIERQSRIKELLTHMGVWERRNERVITWSRGMKQKLALARTLMHRPQLVFLDEPTAGLDVVAAAEVRDSLANLVSKEGVTVFLTTHNMVEAERLCSQVAVIRDGKLIAVGSPDELRMSTGRTQIEIRGRGFSEDILSMLKIRPEIESVELRDNRLYINFKQVIDTAPLISLIVNLGVQVEEVYKGGASLEEVFLTLMEEESD